MTTNATSIIQPASVVLGNLFKPQMVSQTQQCQTQNIPYLTLTLSVRGARRCCWTWQARRWPTWRAPAAPKTQKAAQAAPAEGGRGGRGAAGALGCRAQLRQHSGIRARAAQLAAAEADEEVQGCRVQGPEARSSRPAWGLRRARAASCSEGSSPRKACRRQLPRAESHQATMRCCALPLPCCSRFKPPHRACPHSGLLHFTTILSL